MPHMSHSRDEVVLCVVRILSRMVYYCKKKGQEQLGNYFSRHGALLFSRVYTILEDASLALIGEQ